MQHPQVKYYEGNLSPSGYTFVYKKLKELSKTEPFTDDGGVSHFMLAGGQIVQLDWDINHTLVMVQKWDRQVPEKIKEILEAAKLRESRGHEETSLDGLVAKDEPPIIAN